MIIVVNKKDNIYNGEPFKVYIGRPSPLGNKYSVEKFGRKRCIELFANDLKAALLPLDLAYDSEYLRKMRKEFFRLVKIYQQHKRLILECWCKPLACHGDAIKKELEKHLGI